MEYAEIIELAKKHPDLKSVDAIYYGVTSYKHKQTTECWQESYLINWAFASALRQLLGTSSQVFKYWQQIKPQRGGNML